MPETHVFPNNDAKPHLVQAGVPCWCDPQVLDEGTNTTRIHRPIHPVVPGHTLDLQKVELNA